MHGITLHVLELLIPSINHPAVILESTSAAPTFRGFLIQARLAADDMTVVGQFEEPPAGAEYRYGSCANIEVYLVKSKKLNFKCSYVYSFILGVCESKGKTAIMLCSSDKQ